MRTGSKLAIISILCLGFLLFALTLPKRYLLLDVAEGTLLWNANEADLYVQVTTEGFKSDYLQDLFGVHYGKPWAPDKTLPTLVVIRIRADAPVLKMVGRGIAFESIAPFGQDIYAKNKKTISKWNGSTFIEVSDPSISADDPRWSQTYFTGPDGWSGKRYLVQREDYVFRVDPGGKPMTLVVRRPCEHDEVIFDLARPDQFPEQLWKVSQTSRRVTKAEYEKALAAQ